jgi:hypothetical protein
MNHRNHSRSCLKNNLNTLIEIVEHPKWVWVEGLRIHPEYKEPQKIRTYASVPYTGWVPDLSDRATLAHLTLLFIEAGGSVSFSERDGYLLNEKHFAKDLGEILPKALLEIWGS